MKKSARRMASTTSDTDDTSMCVCVCACVRACARVCVCARAYARVCVYQQSASKAMSALLTVSGDHSFNAVFKRELNFCLFQNPELAGLVNKLKEMGFEESRAEQALLRNSMDFDAALGKCTQLL